MGEPIVLIHVQIHAIRHVFQRVYFADKLLRSQGLAFVEKSEPDEKCNIFENWSFTDVIQNRCFEKFCSIHRKTHLLESPFNKSVFNKVAGLKNSHTFC